jgi:putative nucleotidyltransferase with HDIG domain
MKSARTPSGTGLPRVIAATFVVAGLPLLAAWTLRTSGVIGSWPLSMIVATLWSLCVFHLGGLWWERCRGSRDVLFEELMLWGWVRRVLTERRLASAVAPLGLAPEQLGPGHVALAADERVVVLHRLATDLESFDPYTHGHSRRVARYAGLIAKRMGLPRHEVARIRAAAALHDVGKLYTPREILYKPGPLTDAEFATVKRHASDGARMIRTLVGDEELASIVLHHHERLDGTGYPGRICGQLIPLGSRIIAVADTFDAITSERPYRAAKPHKVALDVLIAEAGTQLDPDAVRAFRRAYFGRRPLSVLVALSNGANGLLLPGSLGRLGSGLRSSGAAVGAAALGGGALLLPAATNHAAPRPAVRAVMAVQRSTVLDSHTLTRNGAPACCRPALRGQHAAPGPTAKGPSTSAGQSTHPYSTTARQPPASPAHQLITPPTPSSGAPPRTPSATGSTASVPVTLGAGSSSVGVTVRAGGSSAGVTVANGGGGGPTVGATVAPGAGPASPAGIGASAVPHLGVTIGK